MKKRNIIVILCDQLRKDFLSVYGCPAIPTPNIDALASMGTVFDNAITQSPVCAPARASMMTGRYVSDHHVWTNDVPFRDGLVYLPERMNRLGYATGAFGKLHHYPAKDAKGFQRAALMEEGRLGNEEPYLAWLKQRHPEARSVWNHDPSRFAFGYETESYYEHFIASSAIDFMDECTKDDSRRPFFSWVSFQGPHTPIDPPEAVKGTVNTDLLPRPICRESDRDPSVVAYRRAFTRPHYFGKTEHTEAEIMDIRTAYAEQIAAIDMEIGRIMDFLRERNLLHHTTIIFSADHGDLLGDFDMHFKGPFIYRGQLEIPLIVTNHPGLKAGVRSDALVGNIDIPATVLAAAGDDKGIGYSRSLLAGTKTGRDWNYSEFCDSVKIVENSQYRYCYYPFIGDSLLFDKQKDPDERVNLSGKSDYQAVETACLKALLDFMVMAKGVRIEAHDMVPDVQKGLHGKHPGWQDDFSVAYPIHSDHAIWSLQKDGLSAEYNNFCRDKDVIAQYKE